MTLLDRDLHELAFCRWLDERYAEDVTQGVTSLPMRRQRARELILRMGEQDRPLVGKNGTTRTIAQAFQAAFGEPLQGERHEWGDGV